MVDSAGAVLTVRRRCEHAYTRRVHQSISPSRRVGLQSGGVEIGASRRFRECGSVQERRSGSPSRPGRKLHMGCRRAIGVVVLIATPGAHP